MPVAWNCQSGYIAPSMSAGSPHLLTQQEKQARVYEEDVYPLVGQKLADLLTQGISFAPHSQVLQVGCGLGSTTTELLHKLDSDGRLIAIESTPSLVERARAGVSTEYLGRRVFFRAHDLGNKLPFADNSFDFTLASAILAEYPSPATLLAEVARVTKPGAPFRLATLLAGSWREFTDVYSDVLVRLHKESVAASLLEQSKAFPEPEIQARELEALGFGDVAVETTRWELVFRTSREFFYAPVIERGPLRYWKAIAGKGPEMQDIFLAVKQAIDTYFGGGPFTVSLVAGVFSGISPGSGIAPAG
jgi:ubiquinone/menaquinone biosynthesis C-methylase UbiE